MTAKKVGGMAKLATAKQNTLQLQSEDDADVNEKSSTSTIKRADNSEDPLLYPDLGLGIRLGTGGEGEGDALRRCCEALL